jgi:hypothetical protein
MYEVGGVEATRRRLWASTIGEGQLMLLRSLHISKSEFEAGTGWTLKPEGACQGHVCIPLSQGAGEIVDVASIARDMAMPLVASEEHRMWALGPATIGSRALASAEALDLK